MDSHAPLVSPVLDKSHLFVYLPTNPQDETRRYLECEAAGHLYCISTGSLLWKKVPNVTSSANILPSLPSNPTPDTLKTFENGKSMDQQCNSAIYSSASINSNFDPTTKKKIKKHIKKTKNKSIPLKQNDNPKVKDIDQPSHGDSTMKPQSNIGANLKNAHQHMQDNETTKILNTQSNRTLEVKHREQLIQADSASGIQNIRSKVKSDQTANVNNTVKPVKCNGVLSISKTTKVKPTGQPIQVNNSSSIFSYKQYNKNPVFKKADQPMLVTNESRTPNAQRNKASKSKSDTSSQANIPIQGAIHSYESINSHFDTITKKKIKKRMRKAKNKDIDSTISKKKSASSRQKKSTELPQSKPNTSFISNPSAAKSKNKKLKNFRPVSNRLNIWEILKPFNRRPHPSRDRQKSLWSNQCKNCIMASSVHEIIHSQFAENENVLLPDPQIRAMLNIGDRKLKTRKKWIQRMEEEAITKYKKLSLENHDRRLHVKEYDVLHHKEKFWLACSSRLVINKKTKESWPLLVKCLDKYPDSTLRQASKHRSFCLRWNGIWHILRMDHAYYTQIQCHMAITNTSYAELIVHTNKETTVLPVYFNSEFWRETEETLETFYTNNLLPYFKNNKIESNPISPPLNNENSNDSTEE